jgi:hypothetical protein
MFRKLFVIGALLGALIAIVVPVATASNGSATPFKATYSQFGVTFTCSGATVLNKQVLKDSETCLVSGDDGYWTTGTYPAGVWQSDSSPGSPSYGLVDQTLTVTKTANGDGTYTETFLAIYAYPAL